MVQWTGVHPMGVLVLVLHPWPLAWDFWDCFLTWPGVQWELFYLNANAETPISQKEGKLPSGARCDSWWSSLEFYWRTGLPCLTTQVPCTVTWFDGRGKMHISHLITHPHWALLPVGRAAGGKQCTHFQFSHAGGAEREEQSGGQQCFVEGNIFLNYPCLLCAKYQESQLAFPNIPLMST